MEKGRKITDLVVHELGTSQYTSGSPLLPSVFQGFHHGCSVTIVGKITGLNE